MTIHQYLLEALDDRLREDLGPGEDGLLELTADADPVLAKLWSNPNDVEYDEL